MAYLIAIIVVVLQVFLSRRSNVYLGAILPAVYLLCMIWLFISRENLQVVNFIITSLAGVALLSLFWIKGREYLKNKRRKELEKIEIENIN